MQNLRPHPCRLTFGTVLLQCAVAIALAIPSPAAAWNPERFNRILDHLVSAGNVSRRPNTSTVDFLKAQIAGAGHSTRCWTLDDRSGCQNLVVRVGPDKAGGIAISGHLDVVPWEAREWLHPPTELQIDGGRWSGRGVTDMLGYVALAVDALYDIPTRRLNKPIWFFFTRDEEIGVLGAKQLASEKDALYDHFGTHALPELMLIGEPTLNQPFIAHKGHLVAELSVRGVDGHSSTPRAGVNAIDLLSAANLALTEFAEGPLAQELEPHSLFDLAHATVVPTQMAGGTAANVIPGQAQTTVSVRALPSTDVEKLSAQLTRVAQDAVAARLTRLSVPKALRDQVSVGFDVIRQSPAYAMPAEAHPMAEYIQQKLGIDEPLGGATFTTDAGALQAIIPNVVIWGPGNASLHKPNEWLEMTAVAAHRRHLLAIIHDLTQ